MNERLVISGVTGFASSAFNEFPFSQKKEHWVLSPDNKHLMIDGESYDHHQIEHGIKKLVKSGGRSICFFNYLSELNDERLLRRFIGISLSSSDRECLVAERETNEAINEAVIKAASCLDASVETKTQDGYSFHLLSADNKTSKTSSILKYFGKEEELLRVLIGHPVQRVSVAGLIDKIKDRLKIRKGFSFVRFNHCEPRVMGYGGFFYDRDVDVTFKIQWGHSDVTLQDRYHLAGLMAVALNSADVIGLPTLKRRIENDLHILENSCFTQLRDRRLIQPGARFIDVNTHFKLGASPEFFDVIANASRVILITGRDVAEKLKKRTGRDEVITIHLPAEAAHTSEKTTRHFPDAFGAIQAKIEETIQPGDLVLVGGGILGKHYCSMCRKKGAVALDIGSLFDAWEGLATRGQGFPAELLLP